MKKGLIVILVCLSASILQCQGGRRKALIIANGAYVGLDSLSASAIKDRDAMVEALTGVGFDGNDIDVQTDLSLVNFREKIHDFASRLTSDDSVVFYFSGHGFSIKGADYLAPVDFGFRRTIQDAVSAAIDLNSVLQSLKIARFRVVILDACRDEAPYLKKVFKEKQPQSAIKTLELVAANGAIIAFATRQGETASARSDGGMSLYTYYLSRNLEAQPAEITEVFRKTAADVAHASHEKQHPAYYDEMEGAFALKRGGLSAGVPNGNEDNVKAIPISAYAN